MRKILSILMIPVAGIVFSQSKEELKNAMLSNNLYEIQQFIAAYPSNPNVKFLEKKAEMIKNGSNSVSLSKSMKAPASFASNTANEAYGQNNVLNKETAEKHIYSMKENQEKAVKAKKSVDLLNHLFSNDEKANEAYVVVKNQSKCNLALTFEGKNYFNLEVPKMSENYILVPKGFYTLKTMVCDSKYSSGQNINKDMQIDFNTKRVN